MTTMRVASSSSSFALLLALLFVNTRSHAAAFVVANVGRQQGGGGGGVERRGVAAAVVSGQRTRRIAFQTTTTIKSSSLLFLQQASSAKNAAATETTETTPTPPPPPTRTLDAKQLDFMLGYSINFHRHILRRQNQNGTATTVVVKSFAFLDDALAHCPTAQRLPLLHSRFSSSSSSEMDHHHHFIAGAGLWESHEAYPHLPPPLSSSSSSSLSRGENIQQIQEYLEAKLKWFPDQVQELFVSCPSLTTSWTIEALQERIEFLTSPLPARDIVAQVNHSVVDWPVQFYRHGKGAGMSVAQLSYALSLVPSVILRADWETDPSSVISTVTAVAATASSSWSSQSTSIAAPHQQVSSCSLRTMKQFSILYAQTPPLVLKLARQQLDALHGASDLDCVAFSYLHWKGWDFHQMRIVIQALPTVLTCSIEPSWELYERGGGGGSGSNSISSHVRKQLKPDSLAYLCYRLQIGPSHIMAMLKTHPRLSGYKVHSLRRNANLLQESLHLSSTQLRGLVLRLPSLLGMSQAGMERRLDFWIDQVGLRAASQLNVAVMKQPSLLQYGVETNLVPKLFFFQQDLGISLSELQSMSVSHPQLWGRSLEGHLRPLATNFIMYMSHEKDGRSSGSSSLHDFGRIIVQAPEIALCTWKGNMKDKLGFLLTDVGLSPDELKEVLLQSPRILMCSLKSSLHPRLKYLLEQEAAAANAQARRPQRALVRQAIRSNPSLLLTSIKTLRKRFDGERSSRHSLEDDDDDNNDSTFLATALHRRQGKAKSQPSRLRIRNRKIQFMVSSGGDGDDWMVQEEFDSAKAAAKHAGLSESHMFLILRQGRPLKNGIHKYVRVNATATAAPSLSKSATKMASKSATITSNRETNAEDTTVVNRTRDRLVHDLESHLVLEQDMFRRLTLYASGRAYPPEDGLRGRRRSGGMALQIPSWTSRRWKAIVQDLWHPLGTKNKIGSTSTFPGDRYHHPTKRRLLRDGQTLILGYSFTRPSRNRCSLYSCLEALRVARVWQRQHRLELEQTTSTASDDTSRRQPCCFDIEIITDSNYCLGWLENTTRLYEWGSSPSKDDFCSRWTAMSTSTVPSPASANNTTQARPPQPPALPPFYQANPDILYPLAKTFYYWMNENNRSDTGNHTFKVKFRKETNQRLGEAAHLASQLMYDTAR